MTRWIGSATIPVTGDGASEITLRPVKPTEGIVFAVNKSCYPLGGVISKSWAGASGSERTR